MAYMLAKDGDVKYKKKEMKKFANDFLDTEDEKDDSSESDHELNVNKKCQQRKRQSTMIRKAKEN